MAAAASALVTAALFFLMLSLGFPLFREGHFMQLILSPWQPEQGLYGIYPMLLSSLSVALLAVLISFPMCLGTSFLLTSLSPRFFRKILHRVIRFTSGIPTVIYGFVAIFLLVPFMREYVTGGSGMSLFTAALVLSVLIAPTMIILFADSLQRVPASYSQTVHALGGNKVQALFYVILPNAWPGIMTGVLMGLGRAMGDTLISLMIAGNSVAAPNSIFDSARTLTAHIALVIAADFASMEFQSIFACGVLLYLFTAMLAITLRVVGSCSLAKR